jgi:hypothetical protein
MVSRKRERSISCESNSDVDLVRTLLPRVEAESEAYGRPMNTRRIVMDYYQLKRKKELGI